ncbi:trigger factor [Luxibacter massiliensis]|uniref:trigger factor n=1 Tax=Luxibacter massiliensis TaxID=2219695 RepID=UPI000F06B44F|nr:trigger factor [Luxibacter massiliensis]
MKKKILAAVLSIFMAVSLAGCSKGLSDDYITIKQYEGLEVPKVEETEVTDTVVDNTINNSLSASATTEEITDRAAQDGDTVNIDYKGSVDGVEFEGGSAQGASLELGSGSFIGANGEYKGFEEQIVGHKTGENFDITVKFPSGYTNAEMSEKVAVFNITINGISVVHVPDLTDEWVQENSETSKTVEEYKKEVKNQLEESYKKSQDSELQGSALDALVQNVDVKKYPDGEVEKQLKTIEEYYQSMADAYGLEFKDFAEQYMGLSEEEFDTEAQNSAEAAVKKELACKLLAEKKNLEPSEEEYEKQIKEYAESSGYEDIDAFKEMVGEDVLKSTIRQQKVAEYLAEKCIQVEQSDETE